MRLTGLVSGLRELKDRYAVGAGGALLVVLAAFN
jgi:hypothetical protein